MPVATASKTAKLAAAVEKTVLDPFRDVHDSYAAAVDYMAAVPEGSPDPGNRRQAFTRMKEQLDARAADGKTLTYPEVKYLEDRATHAVLAFAWYRRDLATDWRR